MIECKICHKRIKYGKNSRKDKNFFIHVGRYHHIKNYEYVKKYEDKNFKFEKCGWCDKLAIPQIEYKNKKFKLKYDKFLCNDPKCKEERKKYNPRSYLATQKTYKMTEKESKKFVSSKSPFHKEYFNSEKEYKESQSMVTLEAFQKRHGKRKGKEKFEEYVKLRQEILSLDQFIKKYGEEEGNKKWKDLCNSKAVTRNKMVEKYGEIEGNKKYEKFLDKTLKNFVSKSSIECLNEIAKQCEITIRHGKNNSEKKIKCKKSTRPVDGYCELYNIVFEFYGDRWHMNPKFFTAEDLNPRRKKASEVWKEDRIRLNDILPEVHSIFIIWENDWQNNKLRTIKRFKEMLNKIKQNKLNHGVYYL